MNEIAIKQPGPQITIEDIQNLEGEIGAELPKDYKSFLLRHNGGVPSPNTVNISGLPGSSTDVQVFFGIEREHQSSNLSWNFKLVKERYPGRDILPIACDSGGSLFCLMLTSENAGEIFFCDNGNSFYNNPTKDIGSLYRVASNFEAFLVQIQ